MNFLSRAIAAELLWSSPSPRKCLLLLHHVPALQHYCYSRTTNSRTGKTQQEQSYTAKNPEAELQKSSLLSRSEMVQKKALVSQREEEKEEEQPAKASMDWPRRPSEIPWQAKVANSVNLIGHVHEPVQFQESPDGKYWAGTIISQQEDDNASDSPPFWIPIIFEGDLAHIAACHLKEKDCIYITGQLSAADAPLLTLSQSQAHAQVMVRSINFVKFSSHLKKTIAPCQKKERGINSGKCFSGMSEDGDPALSSWRDLLKNPERWWDHRENKLNGLVKPRHPDFKHKDSGLALWINSAPKWLLTELEGLEFDVRTPRMKQVKEGKDGDSWKNLVENPDKWWDNRSKKVNKKSPDFKHKDTGEALWLSDSPAWALSRLPPVKAKENFAFGKRNTLLSQSI